MSSHITLMFTLSPDYRRIQQWYIQGRGATAAKILKLKISVRSWDITLEIF